MTAPRYQDIPTAHSEVTEDDGTHARIICGEFWGKTGPVEGVAADPRYVDISVPPGKRRRIQIETTRNAFAYVFAAPAPPPTRQIQSCTHRVAHRPQLRPALRRKNHSLVLFDRGDEIVVQAGPEAFASSSSPASPLKSPSPWYGPSS